MKFTEEKSERAFAESLVQKNAYLTELFISMVCPW